jgi:uncharacterized protein
MKTLYIHGMNSKPWQEGIAVLQEYGLETFALHLKYNHQSFDVLKNFILENQIEFLVGHSHGGFMGYWLAEELGLPCLLINPSVSLRAKKKVSPAVSQLVCPICLVVLGGKDELVNPHRSMQFFEVVARPDKITHIQFLPEEVHSLPLSTFRDMVEWALKLVKEFKAGGDL